VSDPFENIADEELARRAQAGEWAGFDELVRRFEGRIYRFTVNCSGHATDARELTQATFVSAYQHLRNFSPEQSFATWLFTIARRKCIDRSRRTRGWFADEMPELPDGDDPSVLLERREAAEEFWQRARRVLTATQFQTLWLHYVEDLRVREVARVMRRTQPHVKVLLFRARKVLARELRDRNPEQPHSAPHLRLTPAVRATANLKQLAP
jgi:RNA polymerase sigma-70 factor (ECF subfamily)